MKRCVAKGMTWTCHEDDDSAAADDDRDDADADEDDAAADNAKDDPLSRYHLHGRKDRVPAFLSFLQSSALSPYDNLIWHDWNVLIWGDRPAAEPKKQQRKYNEQVALTNRRFCSNSLPDFNLSGQGQRSCKTCRG